MKYKNWHKASATKLLLTRTQTDKTQKACYFKVVAAWWALQDSNLRPRDYESPALTNSAKSPNKLIIYF